MKMINSNQTNNSKLTKLIQQQQTSSTTTFLVEKIKLGSNLFEYHVIGFS